MTGVYLMTVDSLNDCGDLFICHFKNVANLGLFTWMSRLMTVMIYDWKSGPNYDNMLRIAQSKDSNSTKTLSEASRVCVEATRYPLH